MTLAALSDAVDGTKRGRGQSDEEAGVTNHGFINPLAADESGRSQDEGVGFIEIGTRGTDRSTTVFAGHGYAPTKYFARGEFDELSGDANRM